MVNFNINGQIVDGIELVIFDRDGTLIDLYWYWSNMIELRSRLICNSLKIDNKHKEGLMHVMGIDKQGQKIRPGGPVGLMKREYVMQVAVDYLTSNGWSDALKTCTYAFAEADKLSYGMLGDIVKPLKGLFELFDKLEQGACKIAIATTDTTDRAKLTMDSLGLLHRLGFVAGHDSVEHGKPAPDMINLIRDKLGAGRSNTIMVGDALTDVDMGINAKIRASVGVLSGLTSRKEMEKRTKYIINDISELNVQ